MKVEKITYMELHDLYCFPNYSGDHIKEDEMGKACGRYDGEDKCIQNLGRHE
jgi:hypothetical protein